MRPDPDTFNPGELDPEQLTAFRGFVDRVFRDGEHPSGDERTRRIEPATWWVPFVLPPQPKPTLLEKVLGRLAETTTERRRDAAQKATQKLRQEDVVWGLWAGLYAGAHASGEMADDLARDLVAASVYGMNPHAINLPFWGEVLLSSNASALVPPAPPGTTLRLVDASVPKSRHRDQPLGSALPDRALLKQLFLPRPCRNEHLLQVVRAVPWQTCGGDAETLGEVAPCLPGVLAGVPFAEVAGSLARASWLAPDKREPNNVGREWIRQRVVEENCFKGLEGDKGHWVDRLNEQRIWQRQRPLRPPFSCVDLLHVALWANLGATSFDDAIAAVLSLGGDAVACAAAGTFAGAYFGKEGLPAAALARIPTSYPIDDMAKRFAELNAP